MPRLWTYLVAFVVLALLWSAVLRLFIHPQTFSLEHTTMATRLIRCLLPPLMALMMVFTGHLMLAAEQQEFSTKFQALMAQEEARQIQDHRRFTLEIMGLGLAVQRYRQTKLWTEMEARPRNTYIFPEDPKEYPSSDVGKMDVFEKREGDAFEHALSWFPTRTPIPTFMVTRTNHNPDHRDGLDVRSTQCSASVLISEFKVVANIYEDNPDRVLSQVFEFFDEHREVPAVVLFIKDGLFLKHYLKLKGSPTLLNDGPWNKNDPDDAMVAFVLARKDRVDALRPYAKHAHGFHATEWLPAPWSKEAIARFDLLPVLGYLHRPQFVSFVREDGQPLGPKAREEAFSAAWQAALEALPEGQKPARVFYDCGPVTQGARVVPMAQALYRLDGDLDLSRNGYNLFPSLGDTGASSAYVGLALGVMASHEKNDVSAAVCLRREDGASIFFVSPPTAEDRKKQHPGGSDPLNLRLAH